MIPRADIVAWRSAAPWKSDAQVEQDLILSRVLIEMFSDGFLAEKLAFRGGTALHKLHLGPASRYSEDIDAVQMEPSGIGSIMGAVRRILDSFLGKPRWNQKRDSVVLIYRAVSEIPPRTNLRFKVEINTREHFSVLGLKKWPFEVRSRWFSGSCDLTTFTLTELLGTKLRALYQRRKGRDLFDLWLAISQGRVESRGIVDVFQEYMGTRDQVIQREEFEQNLASKMNNHEFLHDTDGLLRPDVSYDPQEAYLLVKNKLLTLL